MQFGAYTYCGKFVVLRAKVPLILGMQFFQDVAPKVDWQSRKVSVFVGKQQIDLPVVADDSKP